SNPYCKHQEWYGKSNSIGIAEYKWHNKNICHNRRQYRKEPVRVSQTTGSCCSHKGRYTSKNHVRQHSSAGNVTDETAYKQSRNCCRGKNRQNGKHLGNTDLYLSKADRCKNKSQHHIKCSDHSRLGQKS